MGIDSVKLGATNILSLEDLFKKYAIWFIFSLLMNKDERGELFEEKN